MNEARDKSYEVDCDTPSTASEVLKVLKNHFNIDASHQNYTKQVTFTSDESQSSIHNALGGLMDDCTLSIN
jgi:hypothetical protein